MDKKTEIINIIDQNIHSLDKKNKVMFSISIFLFMCMGSFALYVIIRLLDKTDATEIILVSSLAATVLLILSYLMRVVWKMYATFALRTGQFEDIKIAITAAEPEELDGDAVLKFITNLRRKPQDEVIRAGIPLFRGRSSN